MLISARVHYATLAMIDLAQHRDRPTPVAAGEITQRQNIPGPFLAQILRTLRAAGWVQSIRGSQGGYRLAADPTTITLLDIAEATGCQESGIQADDKSTAADLALHACWNEAVEASRESLASVRLSDVIEKISSDQVMFYI